jgi:hypothetical protein
MHGYNPRGAPTAIAHKYNSTAVQQYSSTSVQRMQSSRRTSCSLTELVPVFEHAVVVVVVAVAVAVTVAVAVVVLEATPATGSCRNMNGSNEVFR